MPRADTRESENAIDNSATVLANQITLNVMTSKFGGRTPVRVSIITQMNTCAVYFTILLQ